MNKDVSLLLVDDDEDDKDFFQEVLEEVGPSARFMSARDGLDAISILSKAAQHPDIIFLDLNMPRMNGKDCLRQLKSNHRLSQIPVVIYTTSTAPQDVEETIKAGAIGYITKPTDMQKMKTMLASVIESIPDELAQVIQRYSQSGTV